MPIERLTRVLDRDDLDADLVLLTLDVEDLAVMLFRALRLAMFQQEQLARLADLVPDENRGEAQMMVVRGNEVGEAVAAEFLGWLGPGDAERLAAIADKSKGF